MLSTGKKRIDFLFSLKKKASEKKVNTASTAPHGEEQVIGHLALRIAAGLSDNRAFRNWLLESEGDLFEKRLKKESKKVVRGILKDLFGKLQIGWKTITEEVGMGKDQLYNELFSVVRTKHASRYYTDPLGSVALPFEKAPQMVKYRRGLLVQGWFITPWRNVFPAAKRAYQERIEQKIREVQKKEPEGEPKTEKEQKPLSSLAYHLVQYWKSKRRKTKSVKGERLEGKSLYEKPFLFPLCMRLLFRRIQEEGYLSHEGRLQLGFFLKGLGMEVNEQMRFWYENSVDDAGMNWKEFKNGPGYQIRHIYGLEGSKTDYKTPKCDTIINRYFCPYASLSQVNLQEELEIYLPDSSRTDEILEKTRKGYIRDACSLYLQEISGKKRKDIYHPLQFVRLLYKSKSDKLGEKKNGEDKGGKNHGGE